MRAALRLFAALPLLVILLLLHTPPPPPAVAQSVAPGEPAREITLGVPTMNGEAAGTAPGPDIPADSPITVVVGVSNAGDVAVTALGGTSGPLGAMTCQETMLQPGGSTTCTAAGTAAAGPQQVPITITATAEEPPVAVDDSATTPVNTPVDINVLANDTGEGIEVTGATDPENGMVDAGPGGTMTYAPDTDFVGTDTFTYEITNDDGETDTATVTVTVTVPGPCTGSSAFLEATTEFEMPVTLDTRAAYEVTSVSDPANGSAEDHGDGTVTYTPDDGFTGTDTFTYTSEDQYGCNNSQVYVTVTVTPSGEEPLPDEAVAGITAGALAMNRMPAARAPGATVPAGSALRFTAAQPAETVTASTVAYYTGVRTGPTAVDDTATTPEGTSVDIAVLANDTGEGLEVTGVSDPANGSAEANDAGTITYTPDAGFVGTDSFNYQITDDAGLTATATVIVVVTPAGPGPGGAPTAVSDAATTPQDTPVDVGVLANDTGDGIEVTDVGNPANGTAEVNADGTITYTPDDGFVGTDTFTYQITDDNGLTSTATVVLVVTPAGPGPGPMAVDDTATTPFDTPVDIAVLANDSGEGIEVTGASDPANGSVAAGPAGTITYTPDTDFVGTDTFIYQITDAAGDTDTATVTVTVTAAPVAPPEIFQINPQGGPIAGGTAVTILGAGFVPETAASFGGTPATDVTMVSNTELRVTTPPHPAGTVDVTATNPDGQSDTYPGGFTYIAPPVANDDTATTEKDTPAPPIDVLANDSGDGITVTAVGAPAHGTAMIDEVDDTIGYIPDAGFTGTDRFTYTITDVVGQQATATVTVTVTPAPRATITLGEPAVNSRPAGSPPGPSVPAGSALTVAVPVTNTGDVAVTMLAGTSPAGALTCQATTLTPGASTTCTVASTAADGPQQVAITVTAQGPNSQPFSAQATAFYTSGPTVISIMPSSGPEAGGTAVTISGNGFLPGRTSVAFGGTPAASVTCTSTTTCTAMSPPGRGTVSVHVTTPAGSSADTAADHFTYIPPPQPMALSVQVWRQIPPIVSENQTEPTIVPAVGEVVEALVDGTVCGQGVTDSQGRVHLTVAADPPATGCGQEGAQVSFRVNGEPAASDPLRFQSGSQAAVTLRLPGPMPPRR